MCRLSVNINKFATLRNARGGNNPDLIAIVKDCERFGAQGITVHPRPDERHITFEDVVTLKDVVKTEFNIEGYPDERFLKIIELTKPTQATLVPDAPDVLTSNAGWDTKKHTAFLKEVVQRIKKLGVRTSLFIDPIPGMINKVPEIGSDRIELYTESYATEYRKYPQDSIFPYKEAAEVAKQLGLGINAGHDLDLENLAFFSEEITPLEEVSIGHALVCDALYFGLENTIQMYLKKLHE